ncbi:MAG: MFS transporter [Anaerolineales bacterium]|nr:MFS transporter [Anaerolineales bacterium]
MKRTRSRTFWLAMFGLLYFVQGSALAYFRNYQKPYLSGLGVDPDVIGLLTSILLLPFIIKIFIGMLSDRVNLFRRGHRVPYIVLGLVLAALFFAGSGLAAPDQNLTLFGALIVLGSFSVTIFDSTTDGLAIDVTPAEEHGRVQGAMVGGRAAGFIVLSLVFGALITGIGGEQPYRIVFFIIALSMLIPLFWVLRVKEPEERDRSQQFEWRAFRCMGQKRFLLFALYAVVYSIGSFGVDGLVTLFMSQGLGASESVIGQYGAMRGLGAVIGAIGGGLLIDRLGRKRSAFGGVLAISLVAFLIALATGARGLLGIGVLWGVVWGFQETIFVALAMDLSDSRIAASMFALMMAFSNIGTAVGEGVATGLTDNLPFSTVFLALAGVNLLVLPILWGLFRVAPEVGRRAKINRS